MLVTDSFVFVHVPKTGGTFIQTVLRGHLPVEDYRPYTHIPYAKLPKRWRHLPGFYVVRNPWDWYVSWFSYGQETKQRREGRAIKDPRKRAIWEGLFRRGEADFAELIHRACTGDFAHPLTHNMREEGIDLYSA